MRQRAVETPEFDTMTLIDESGTSDSVGAISRASASRLTVHDNARSLVEVEAALATGPNDRPQQYVDPVSVGALIVGLAKLAWDVYTDLKSRTDKPSKEIVARKIRIQLSNSELTPALDDQNIIDVVVDETIKEGERDD
jgi:hypothetical protein